MSYMQITLPSRCQVYKDVQAEDITVRPYKVKDEAILSQISPHNIEQKYLQVMRDTVKGVDPLDLTIGDRTYIMLWAYINSYSKTDRLQTTCSHCLEPVTAVVDLNSLGLTYLPEDFKNDATVKIEGPDGKMVTVGVRLITVRDEIETEKYSANHKDALVYRYARTISMGDKSAREIKDWLSDCPAASLARIRKWHEANVHGPVMLTTYECPECEEEEQILVPFRIEYLYPEGETLENIA